MNLTSASTLSIRLVRKGRTVASSVVKGKGLLTGRDWRCQLLDPENPSARQKLLSRRIWGYHLILPPGAEGTLTYRGSTVTVGDLLAWGLATRTRKELVIPLRKGMTGKLTVGSSTYILEYIRPAAAMASQPVAAGHLPWKYRLLTPNRTDLTFLLLLTLVLLAHVGALETLERIPIPEVTRITELPRRISRLILEPAMPPPAQTVRKGEVSGEGETAPAEPEPEPQANEPEESAPPGREPAAPPTRETIRSQVSDVGVLGVLTGRGTAGRTSPGTGISVLDLDAELQQDLERVLGEVSGITRTASVAGTEGGAGAGGTEPGSGLLGIENRLEDANVSGPVQVSGLGTGFGDPAGSPTGSGAGEKSGSLTEQDLAPEAREERSTRTIARVVAAHTGAIRYAYNRELRKKPSLRGKIVLTFTISPEGEVTQCHVQESAVNWPPLENSLVKIVKTWKFPPIPAGDVTVSYPLVFFPSM